MRMGQCALLVLTGGLLSSGALLSAKEATLTGKVGDAACGVKHMMADEAACTAGCVKKGSDYALIVSDMAYTLKASDQMKAQLSKLAGKQARVVGDLNGTTLTVTSVQAP